MMEATTPLRILAVTNMYPTGQDPAYGAFVASQMRSIEDAGHTVQIEFVNGRESIRQYLRAIGRVRALARTGRFDLVHAHYGLTGYIAAFQPLPLVVSYCGDDLLGTPNGRGGLKFKSRVIRRFSHVAARRAAAIVCKTEQLRQALPRTRDRARAKVIPNGVDLKLFTPGPQGPARARLGLPLDEKLILFPHTPGEPRKRIVLAEEAVALLRGGGINARLWIVHGVPQDSMPDHYRAADCLLLTSEQEGSPNVVKEALCCDVPVVSVDAGDAQHWLSLAPGSRCVARDPAAIAQGVREALGSSRADGALVREQLSLPRVAESLVAVYRQAIGQPA